MVGAALRRLLMLRTRTLSRPSVCKAVCDSGVMNMLCLLGPPAVRLDEELRPLKLRPKALGLLVRVALDGPVRLCDARTSQTS